MAQSGGDQPREDRPAACEADADQDLNPLWGLERESDQKDQDDKPRHPDERDEATERPPQLWPRPMVAFPTRHHAPLVQFPYL